MPDHGSRPERRVLSRRVALSASALAVLGGCAAERSGPPAWRRTAPESDRAPQRIPVPDDGFRDFLARTATIPRSDKA